MFLNFFTELRAAKVPVSLREYLTLLDALDRDLADKKVEEFYYLSRACLVKDERHFDRFDQVFARTFSRVWRPSARASIAPKFPDEWLRKLAERYLSEEEKREIEALGWDKLFETLKKRLAEQKDRHQGGNKWIGTGGTSPYGAHGYNPEGIRIGQEKNRNFRAVKVWDKREFKDFDDSVELGVRNMRVALRRLRRFARSARRRRTRSRRDDPRDGAQGLSRREPAAGAPQCREGAAVSRCGRFHGLAHPDRRGAVFGGAARVQAFRAFLLSQLRL